VKIKFYTNGTHSKLGYGKGVQYMTERNLQFYNKEINELALGKGYNQTPAWLFWKALIELGELAKAFEEGKMEEIGFEYADVEHMLQQILTISGVKDPDFYLQRKIEMNWNTKKKTLGEDGKIVRK